MADGASEVRLVESEGPISLGFDDKGDEHILFADRNFHHRPEVSCGCNPDGYDDENPYGPPQPEIKYHWSHHAFSDEIGEQATDDRP